MPAACTAYGYEPADDVEGHVSDVIFAEDVDLGTKIAALSVLTNLRPLRPSTVDALLTYYQSKLSHITALYSKEECGGRCVVRRPECAILSISLCQSDCETACEYEHKLAKGIASLLQLRVRSEQQTERRRMQAVTTGVDEVEELLVSGSTKLAAAASRLREASSASPSLFAPRDIVIDPTAFKHRLLTGTGRLAHGRTLRSSTVASARERARSLRTVTHGGDLSPSPSSSVTVAHGQLMYRARRLGILTLIGEC